MGIKLMKNSVNVHLLVIEVALNNFLKSRREEEDENLFPFLSYTYLLIYLIFAEKIYNEKQIP